ncbi:MAG: hydrogenase maturation protease [Nannocystaceae bacterium]|nr:hydrogenase maturation protease [Myxococcales bacterium]
MSRVRVICLGNAHASDDGAALQLAGALAGCEVRCAGRPGAGLLDLLEGGAPVVLVDATQSGAPPGTIHTLELAALADAALAGPNVSSHGFGPAQALVLGQALGRPLPRGIFVGVEGEQFTPGEALSPAVAAAMPALTRAVQAAIEALTADA